MKPQFLEIAKASDKEEKMSPDLVVEEVVVVEVALAMAKTEVMAVAVAVAAQKMVKVVTAHIAVVQVTVV